MLDIFAHGLSDYPIAPCVHSSDDLAYSRPTALMSCRSLSRIQCASDSARLVSLRVQERRGRRQEERPGAPRVCEQPAFGATGAKGLQQRNAVARRAPAALLPSVSFRSMSFQNFRLGPPGSLSGFSDIDTPPHSALSGPSSSLSPPFAPISSDSTTRVQSPSAPPGSGSNGYGDN